MSVTNTGGHHAATVVQLYAGFPPLAAQPAPLLKGFAKTPVPAPGAKTLSAFELTTRDLSYYNATSKKWARVDHVDLHVGASSTDIRARRRAWMRPDTK